MDSDRDDEAERGLRGYVEAIARELNVEPAATVCEWSPPANAYIALAERLLQFPSRDFALVWDEAHGWAATVETSSGGDLIVLGYLTGELLPAPPAVAAFARGMLADRFPLQVATPPAYNREDLAEQLADYARPQWMVATSLP